MSAGDFRIAPNFQVHTLSSLFFRNKSAFIIGRVINGDHTYPMVIPVIHAASGKLVLDTVLLRPEQLLILFSFAHAYFLVDMEIPSAYVTFLRDLMPRIAQRYGFGEVLVRAAPFALTALAAAIPARPLLDKEEGAGRLQALHQRCDYL